MRLEIVLADQVERGNRITSSIVTRRPRGLIELVRERVCGVVGVDDS